MTQENSLKLHKKQQKQLQLLNSECVLVCSRKKTERSKKFFTDLMAKEHVPTMINPKPCGHLCCCAITGCEEVGLALKLALMLAPRLSPVLTNRLLSQIVVIENANV